jgi:phosphoribosylamine--glycine ligase
MNVLIIGSGGRESALAWRLLKDDSISRILVSPGNAGMSRMDSRIECLEGQSIDDYLKIAQNNNVDYTFVGPEGPLVAGICNLFDEHDLAIIGPSRDAAELEGSKIFSKIFMEEFEVPTARFKIAKSFEEALAIISDWPFSKNGFVIKADGLAGGKGVVVALSYAEAKDALHSFMVDPSVKIKSPTILLEEVLLGREASFFALCNGDSYQVLGTACDHKRLNDGDEGPNTGGMGCFHDPLWPTEQTCKLIETNILKKTLSGMKKRGTPYKGILFIGVMIDSENIPYVVEYNVRFGDPETQTLMPLIKGDFSQLLHLCANNKLDSNPNCVSLEKKVSVHIVMTARGYPSVGKHEVDSGRVITVDKASCDHLFYAGVKSEGSDLLTSGGRVLGVTALADTMINARQKAYHGIEHIKFVGSHYRRDIGLWRE